MELKDLKEKQDKEFVKMLLDDPDCSDEEAYKRTINFLDKVRKETCEAKDKEYADFVEKMNTLLFEAEKRVRKETAELYQEKLEKELKSQLTNNKMNLLNIIEYDGQWHKKGDDGNCEKFTMRDLKELLKEEKRMAAECVCDRMINKKCLMWACGEKSEVFIDGYKHRIKEEKEIKKQIIKELK